MSIRKLALALVMSLAFAWTSRAALAQEPPKPPESPSTCSCGGQVSDFVDFSKPPNEIEGQNKVRIGIQPVTNPKTGQLSLEVLGIAYYPDGVTLTVGIRHARVKGFFDQKKVTVKDHSFAHTFGPFQKSLPGGGIAIEAVFVLAQQSQAIQKELQAGEYFKHKPPCKHDKGNLTQVHYSLGGEDAEKAAVKAEKDAIAEARKGLVDAFKAAEVKIAKVESKESSPDAAAAILTNLDKDLEAVSTVFNNWKKTRQFGLFPARVAQLTTLKEHIRETLRARAVLAGATVQGLTPAKAHDERDTEEKEITRISDDLKGFLDDPDALDHEAKTDAAQPNNAQPNPQASPATGNKPPAPK